MSMFTDQELNVVAETKREMSERFREQLLDAFCIAHEAMQNHGLDLFKKAMLETRLDKGLIAGIAAATLTMSAATMCVEVLAKQLDIPLADLEQGQMMARYERLKAAGKVSA